MTSVKQNHGTKVQNGKPKIKRDICADCRDAIGEIQVFQFDDEDGKPVMMCEFCYNEHDRKGDWCS